MPSPVETVPSPQPETGFDPLVFWIQHKRTLGLLFAVLVIALLVSVIFQFTQRKSREASERAFASAKSVEDFQKVIAEYPRSVVAANAELMVAEKLRGEAKYDEAVAALRKFTDTHGQHPLVSGAWTSLAVTQEAQGNLDAALATYQRVATTYPTSFSAPVALLAEARILKGQGKTEPAKRLYEEVVSQFGQTNFAREALMEMQKLKPAAPAAEGSVSAADAGKVAPVSAVAAEPKPAPALAPAPIESTAPPAAENKPAEMPKPAAESKPSSEPPPAPTAPATPAEPKSLEQKPVPEQPTNPDVKPAEAPKPSSEQSAPAPAPQPVPEQK